MWRPNSTWLAALGVAAALGAAGPGCATAPPDPGVTDRDGDGVPDDNDYCPDVPSPDDPMGCPLEQLPPP